MPIPFFLIAAYCIGGAGLAATANGLYKTSNAKDRLKAAQDRNDTNLAYLEQQNVKTCQVMDELGKTEISILQSFQKFADLIEKIQGRPTFEKIQANISLPSVSLEDIKKTSIGAVILASSLKGTVAGTAGGFAASGITTAAVGVLGKASTGVAISSLHGAAATNAIYASIGGGSIASGGGGIALGTQILGAASIGVGLLIGGIIISVTGSNLCDKADEAWEQMLENEKIIEKTCNHLDELFRIGEKYKESILRVRRLYDSHLKSADLIIQKNKTHSGFVNWNSLSDPDQLTIENLVLLVGLLYQMCKLKIVRKSANEKTLNGINRLAVSQMIEKSEATCAKLTNSKIENAEYYLVGDFNKWDKNKLIPLVKDKYGTYSADFETTAINQYWKIQLKEGVIKNDLSNFVVGISQHGDTSSFGDLIIGKSAQAGKIEKVGMYRFVFNPTKMTFIIKKL